MRPMGYIKPLLHEGGIEDTQYTEDDIGRGSLERMLALPWLRDDKDRYY